MFLPTLSQYLSINHLIPSSSIINNFSSNKLFLKGALVLSFKPSNFVPGPEIILRPELMVADIPVGPSKKTLGFSESLQ